MNKSNNYHSFGLACEKGHLEVVKYLCKTFNDDLMNKADYYYGFRHAC